jgi:conjugative relaxase-like TrwC/TraI family protein
MTATTLHDTPSTGHSAALDHSTETRENPMTRTRLQPFPVAFPPEAQVAWFRMMGIDSVAYHRATVLAGGDDHPGAARRYYGSRGEAPLEWGGSLAPRLGLTGQVSDDAYDAVFGPGGAVDPATRWRPVRTTRPGVELVVSAHKSVAVLGVLGAVDDTHAIVDAETDATLAFLDTWFRRQGGRRGRAQTRTHTSGLLWARTRHLTSRAGDPEPHDHILIANLTEMLDEVGGWKALDTGGLRDLVHAATMVGRLAAAQRAVELGYAIEADPGPSGKLDHWRITGIPDHVLELFSKRSSEIDAELESTGFDSYRARGIATRNSRASKADTSGIDLWQAWRDELTDAGINPRDLRSRVEAIARRANEPPRTLSSADRSKIVEGLLAADGPLADRKAFTRADLIRNAAPVLYGCHADELDHVVTEVLHHPDAIALVGQPGARGRAWAVASVLNTEDAIANTAARLADRTDAPACPELTDHLDAVAAARVDGHQLTAGQGSAAHAVLTSGRGLDVIVGVAGSGKTTALKVVHHAFAAKGYRVLGTATSGQATRGLREGAEVESFTVASLTHRLDHGRITLDDRTVVLIDEAGMTDDRSLLRLLTAVDHARAKAVMIGDHRQLSAVALGGALEALTARHPDAVHVLDHNIRQPDPAERTALEHLRHGNPADAVNWYAANSRITTSPTRTDTIRAAVEAWSRDRDAGHETILLAWRRADVAALNRVARANQIAKSLVTGPELEAPGGRRYAAGDHVVMLTPDRDRGWVTSQRGHVTAVSDQALTIRFDHDQDVALSGIEIDDDHLDHAYALTVHRTQGATVDTAHVLADGGGRELAYVAMSRARTNTHVHAVADNLDQARDDLTRDWTTERRERWIHDTGRPADIGEPRRPTLARRHGPIPEKLEGCETADVDEELTEHYRKVQELTRRLDALQRGPRSEGGLGLG